MATKSGTSTADGAYQARRVATSNLVARLQSSLAEHAVTQSSDPRNWGFAGDLTEVQGHLESALRQLTGVES